MFMEGLFKYVYSRELYIQNYFHSDIGHWGVSLGALLKIFKQKAFRSAGEQ